MSLLIFSTCLAMLYLLVYFLDHLWMTIGFYLMWMCCRFFSISKLVNWVISAPLVHKGLKNLKFSHIIHMLVGLVICLIFLKNSYWQWYLNGPSIHIIGYCAEWWWGWDWQIDEWLWYGIHSSWRDQTYWQSRQCQCFDTRSKFPCGCRGTTYNKEPETNKKRKKAEKIPRSHGNAMFLHILERIVFWRAEFPTNLMKVLQLSIPILISMFWLNYLFNKMTSIRNKTEGTFSTSPRKWNLSLV